jgi:DNA/RNA endonuclease YhcR with UshA esterase domain
MAIVAAGGFGSLVATAGVKVAQTLTGDEALQHLEETNTVCGTVATAKYVKGAPGNPTYLNFDRPFPNQSCSAVIAEATRARFKDAPETAFTGKWVCVTGLITTNYRGKAQITVSDPAQIVIQDAPAPPATNQTNAATSQ